MNGDMIYVVNFYPECKRSSGYYVWSHHKEYVDTFVKQHYLDPTCIRWIVFPWEELADHLDEVREAYMLEPYRIGSNDSDVIYTVITSDEFMEQALTDLCDGLTELLTLGPCALHGEHECISKIIDLVNALPYSYVYDAEIADASGDEECENVDYSYTYDGIFAHRGDLSYVQPLTLEAYIRSFTNQLLNGGSKNG